MPGKKTKKNQDDSETTNETSEPTKRKPSSPLPGNKAKKIKVEKDDTKPPVPSKAEIKKQKRVAALKSQKRPAKKPAKTDEQDVKVEAGGAIEKAIARAEETGKYVGAHTSITGGLENAVLEAVDMGARAFGMFLKSQRQWTCKPMEEKAAEKFRQAMQKYNYSPNMVVPHGSYLMNCGSPNPETLEKSRNMLVDELQRCERLGLAIFNFHPGSTCGEISKEDCIVKIAASINKAHEKSKYVIAVIENMSCQGNTLGGKFEELRDIIAKVKDKSRVGVCLDTCHAFAAGYDVSTEKGYNNMVEEFDKIVGLDYLKAIHLNDSKGMLGCHLDRHENIGRGKIGKDGFKRLMNDPRFNNIPMILETPQGDYKKEINTLYKLCT